MKISNFSAIIATFSISAILYCLKGWLKTMGIVIPNWVIGIIGISGLAYVVIIEVVPLFKKHRTINKKTVLKDIWDSKKDNECASWNYGEYGRSTVPYNETWQQWIKGLLVTTNRPDLDYYNFGDEFYFVDLNANKEILIPTGNRARNERVGCLFHNGMVVRLMPRKT